MSEGEVKNKESTGDQEVLKKKEIVEDAKSESEATKEIEDEKPTNGIHSSSEEESKSKDNDEEKEALLENSKEDNEEEEEQDEKDKDEEDFVKVSKKEDSKADESEEAMDESVDDSKVDDSVNNSKNETNEDEEEEEEEEEEDESMDVSKDESVDETPKKGILEQPVEMKGKRERKKVERFVQETKKEEVEIEGRGVALKEIPYIQNMILKTGPEDLKCLHRLAYNRPGSAPEIRKNLYKFKGFPFIKDDKAFERKKASAEKIVMPELKKVLNILGLERSGVKSVLVERLMTFLLEPFDAGKQVSQGKRRKSASKKRGSNKKKKEKGAKESQSADSDSGSDDDDDDEKSDEEEKEEEEEPEQQVVEEEEEEEESAVESEPEEKPKKKPAKKKAAAKPAPKKTPQPKKTPKAKAAKTPKTPKTPKTQQKKRPIELESDDSDDSNVSEEPQQKKAKKSPTDTEIETFIKKLLEKADLNEVTMKKLCQQVYDNYPGQDISHKKDFIKSTVKSILS